MIESYWRIQRPANGIMAAVAVAIGYILVTGFSASTGLLIGMLSVFLIAGAGIVLNDCFDLEMDRINTPSRPIPSGKISEKNAFRYSAVLFVAGIALSSLVNIYCLALALLNSALEIAYAWKLKRIALAGNFTDSWFPASSFIYGAFAAGGASLVVVFIALLAFIANAGREIFGDIQDLKGDRKAGAKTLPVIAGEKTANYAATFLVLIAVFLSIVPWLFGLMNLPYLCIIIVADALFVYSVFQEPEKNQKFMRAAMVVSMAAFIAGVL